MRGLLVGLAVMTSGIIVTALVRQKPVDSPIIVSMESPISLDEPADQQVPKTILAATTNMPEPVLLTSLKDLAKVADPGLKTFIRRKANFRNDQVLYFEWHGAPEDKMTGELVSSQKKYTITLRPHPVSLIGQEVVHRQVFLVPTAYTYVCEIAK